MVRQIRLSVPLSMFHRICVALQKISMVFGIGFSVRLRVRLRVRPACDYMMVGLRHDITTDTVESEYGVDVGTVD